MSTIYFLGGYFINMRVQDKRGDLGVGWAIEFDGPSHFWACMAPTGATLITRRHLELLGCILVCVLYWEWDGLSGMDERRKYLQGKLQCNVGADKCCSLATGAWQVGPVLLQKQEVV